MARIGVFARALKSPAVLLSRFCRDEAGTYAILVALAMPVLVGTAGLGTEYGLWVYKQHAMLSAADSGAVSAATAGSDVVTQANAVTASYGFANGVNGTTVTVNQPPKSGAYTGNPKAIEVIVKQSQPRLFSALFGTAPIAISARAVAIPSATPIACVLALDPTASNAAQFQGSTSVALNGCAIDVNSSSSSALSSGGTLSAQSVNVVGGISGGTSSIRATDGIHTGITPVADPYAQVSVPSFSGCDYSYYSANTSVTISPGVYCGGIGINGGASIFMRPGIYILDQGSLNVRSGTSISGTGVTIIFTSSTGSNWATASIQQNGSINLSAPSSGPTAGIVLFGDRNMPKNTAFTLTGTSSQYFAGALYLPKAALTFTGNSSVSTPCTQIIANTVTFTGNSDLKIMCTGAGTTSIGSATGQLVE